MGQRNNQTAVQAPSAQFGFQRDWIWRGWRIRYTHIPAASAPAATPILMIHGFGSNLEQWRSNLGPLSQHHPVYAMDLLGFGASQKAATQYSIDLWAAQIYEFWRLWLRCPIILVGHSLGALASLTASVCHPEMVKGAVFLTLPEPRQAAVSSWARPWVSAIEGVFANPLLLRLLLRLVRRRSLIRSVLTKIYKNQALVTEEVISSFTRPAYDQGVGRSFCYLAKSATQVGYSPSLSALFPQLQCPALMLWGQEDLVVPYSKSQPLLDLNPNVRLVSIPDVGHCLYDEASLAVNQAILDWINTELG